MDDGVVDAAKMRKVWGQGRLVDRGPTERRLREWLTKDPKGYNAEITRLEGEDGEKVALREENAALKAEVERLGRQGGTENLPPGPDLGTERVRQEIVQLLRARG